MTKHVALPSRFPNDLTVDQSLALEHGLSEQEWRNSCGILGRTPSYAELGVLSVMWSEHCSYKSTRLHLRRLPTKGPRVVQGPGENAGAVDIGHGFCAVFKMESHNHPSFIEPVQGAATGVGGILRDVFTMGARPIASLNSLRFGSPEHPRTPYVFHGVVQGIGSYGNCVGVPTVGGEVQFHESYNGNILVNAFTVGIAKSDRLFFGRAAGIGNPVLYVGARTGRDGIHGATMASAEFDVGGAAQKLPTVQVGDPFREKLLLEACLEIFALDCLEGIQDMGAAGLTSSAVEMASRGGTGIELDLDLVPRRARNLTPYEILLSESQERMLMVAKKGREHEVFAVCQKWDLDVAVIGHVTDSGRFTCRATPGFDPGKETARPDASIAAFDVAALSHKPIAVNLPIDLLAEHAPCYDRPQRPAQAAPRGAEPQTRALDNRDSFDAAQALLQLMGSANIGSRHRVWRRYDHTVGNGTVLGPGQSDAAIVRAWCDGLNIHLALSVDGNGRHVGLQPFTGSAMAVAECARNVVCSGAEPLGLTDCLNFGSPENPETMWVIGQSIDGIAAACEALEIPVVSGNVSLYNETNGHPILPTPIVAIVGKLEAPEHRLRSHFQDPGDCIGLLGGFGEGALRGSEWEALRGLSPTDRLPQLDLAKERNLQRVFRELAHAMRLKSAHDCSDGGFAVDLAGWCVHKGLGAYVRLPEESPPHLEACLFGEDPSRVIISFHPDQTAAIESHCSRFSVPFVPLGEVTGAQLGADEKLEIASVLVVSVSELRDAHANALTL